MNYATADGTAIAGSDYFATNGVLTFAAGDTTKSVTVKVRGDLIAEATETFLLNLSNPSNASIGRGSAQGTINDNDKATITIDDLGVRRRVTPEPLTQSSQFGSLWPMLNPLR